MPADTAALKKTPGDEKPAVESEENGSTAGGSIAHGQGRSVLLLLTMGGQEPKQ